MQASPRQLPSQGAAAIPAKRKQYQSCDHCRKRRRACDALLLGIDPFGNNGSEGPETQRIACTTCQKSHLRCTFEWLRSLPQENLPRGVKRKLNATIAGDLEPASPASLASPALPARANPPGPPGPTVSSPSGQARHSFLVSPQPALDIHGDRYRGVIRPGHAQDGLDYVATGNPSVPARISLELDQSWSHVPVSVEPARSYVTPPRWVGFEQCNTQAPAADTTLAAGNGHADWLAAQTQQGPYSYAITRPSVTSVCAAELGGFKGADPPRDRTQDPGDRYQGSRSRSPLDISFLVTPSTEWASLESHTMSAAEHVPDADDGGSCCAQLSQSFSAQTPRTDLITSHEDEVEVALGEEIGIMNDFRLSQTTSKSMIVEDLTQIYNDSMESFAFCWVADCPYESGVSDPAELSSAAWDSRSPGAAIGLYNMAHELDSSFSVLRQTPLTRRENAGASKALRLAIMAFASQWSQSASDDLPGGSSSAEQGLRISDGRPGNTPDSLCLGADAADSFRFERLLRQSLWHEAHRSISRWAGCDSFRVILAQIIFSVVQRPFDEDDLDEIESYYFHGQHPPSEQSPRTPAGHNLNILVPDADRYPHGPGAASILTGTFTGSQSWKRLTDAESRNKYLHVALRRLLAWKRRVQTLLRGDSVQAPPEMARQMVLQRRFDFNRLFWLGVIFDTTSSVLDKRPRVISDRDCAPQAVVSPTEVLSRLSAHLPGSAQQGSSDRFPSAASTTPPTGPNLWDSYLLHRPLPPASALLAPYPTFLALAERAIQSATAIKIILCRRVGTLQALLTRGAPAAALDACIDGLLRTYAHWNTAYGGVLARCLAEHAALPYRLQSWYVVLAGHWHLGCLTAASCIAQAGRARRPDLVPGLRWASAAAVADLARVSCDAAARGADGGHFHAAVRRGAVLTEPWSDVFDYALTASCELLLEWLRWWRSGDPGSETAEWEWVVENTRPDELVRHCGSCIGALKLLGRKSDVARLSAAILGRQLDQLL